MFIVTTVTYPVNRSNDVVARFQKALATPLPPFLKRMYTLTGPGEAGIKVHGIYEVADDKVPDAYRELLKYFVNFYDGEGFKYTVEPMMTAQEAIPLLKR